MVKLFVFTIEFLLKIEFIKIFLKKLYNLITNNSIWIKLGLNKSLN